MWDERPEKTEHPFNVCLLGVSLDDCNMGLRALAASLIGLIFQARPEARFYLLYGNRSAGTRQVEALGRRIEAEVINYRLSPRARLQEHLLWILLLAFLCRIVPIRAFRAWLCRRNRWLGTLAGADLIGSIHAGDSFSDIYGLRRFIVGILPDLTVILMRKELVMLPQTYGPLKSRAAKLVARFILQRSVRLYGRDHKSLLVARTLLGAKRNQVGVQFCPDVAFALEPVQADYREIHPPLDRPLIPLLVGLNISGLLYMGGYSCNNMFGLILDYRTFVRRLVERLLQERGAHVLIVPHVLEGAAESDLRACRAVWGEAPQACRERVHLLDGKHDQSHIKHVIGQCDFFIGSRMHACIAAISQGIPSVGIAYSRKFTGVFRAAGVEDMVINACLTSEDELLEQCLEQLRNRDLVRQRLAERMPAIRAQLTECFKDEIACGFAGSAGSRVDGPVRHSTAGMELPGVEVK